MVVVFFDRIFVPLSIARKRERKKNEYILCLIETDPSPFSVLLLGEIRRKWRDYHGKGNFFFFFFSFGTHNLQLCVKREWRREKTLPAAAQIVATLDG